MKNKVVVLFFFTMITSLLYAELQTDAVFLGTNENDVKILSSSNEGIIFELTIGEYIRNKVEIEGDSFYSISLPEENNTMHRGLPDLPRVTRSIIVPNNADCIPKIISKEFVDVELQIAPSKGLLVYGDSINDTPYMFSEFYTKNKFFPESNIDIGKPFYFREKRGVSICFNPFSYNPVRKKLRICTRLTVSISYKDSNQKSSLKHSYTSKNKHFDSLYKKFFVNYESNQNEIKMKSTSAVEENGKMLIICYDNYIDEMQDFVVHKINRGLDVELVSISDIGSTSNDVKSYIQGEYDSSSDLAFVLLVGGHNQVPSQLVATAMNSSAYCKADAAYSLVSGDDIFPDIIVGRFPAETESQVLTMVERSIYYENMSEQEWFHNGLCIANHLIGHDNLYSWEHLREIGGDLLNWYYSTISELYDGSHWGNDAVGNPTAQMVNDIVNNGVSLINYCAHGSATEWETSEFSTDEVNLLENDDKLPFVFSCACLNGRFSIPNQPTFAESWLRATNDATNRPTGAIGFYGASQRIPVMFDQIQDEFNKHLIMEEYVTLGGLCNYAFFDLMEQASSASNSEFDEIILLFYKTYNYFGDPSITVIPNNNYCRTKYIEDVLISDRIYNSCKIDVINTSVEMNANIIFEAEESTTIRGPFEVGLGSSLEVK